MYRTVTIRYTNSTGSGVTNIIPSPVTYTDPTAASEYNAATVSSIVFGIFMAFLTLYTIWQNGVRYMGTHPIPRIIQELFLRCGDRFAQTTAPSHHEQFRRRRNGDGENRNTKRGVKKYPDIV
jgi:hypothetical protein